MFRLIITRFRDQPTGKFSAYWQSCPPKY